MVNELSWSVQYLLHRLPRLIIKICHLKEVDELGQAFNDVSRRVFKRFELCHVSHFNSIMRIHQALSSFADFLSVVLIASVWLVPSLFVLFLVAHPLLGF